MTKKKGNKVRLPNKIIALPNPDKTFHEKWHKNRCKLNPPHPYRILCLGPPNVGKTTLVKNIILRTKPEFEEIYVIHCDGNYTKEYDDIGVEMLEEIPAPEEWEGLVKTLVILDDLEYKSMNKIQKRNLDRLYGFCSTHKNISVMLCSQDTFNVPPIVRRCSNLFVLWKSPDLDSMSNVARKTGLQSKDLKNIFDQLMKEPKDSLWIDLTDHSPYPLRKNGFIIINKKIKQPYKLEENNKDIDKLSVKN